MLLLYNMARAHDTSCIWYSKNVFSTRAWKTELCSLFPTSFVYLVFAYNVSSFCFFLFSLFHQKCNKNKLTFAIVQNNQFWRSSVESIFVILLHYDYVNWNGFFSFSTKKNFQIVYNRFHSRTILEILLLRKMI